MATTACRATAISVTPDGGSALTASFPVKAKPIKDDEIPTKNFSDSRQVSIFGGNEVAGLEITVCDLEFYQALKKGTRVTTASVTVESTKDADGTALTAGDALTATLTGGYVSEDPSQDTSVDGLPIEWTFKIMLCRGKDGTEGTFVES